MESNERLSGSQSMGAELIEINEDDDIFFSKADR